MKPKVLAVIVAHPFRKVSGATNAGLALSLASAQLTDIELAVMWDADESAQQGPLRVRRVRCKTPVYPLSKLLPRQVQIAFTDSEIPRLIAAGAYDLVHIHNLFPLFAAEKIVAACVRSKTPFVISTHGFFELSSYSTINRLGRFKAAAARWLIEGPFRRIVAQADCLFCLSPADLELLAELGFGDKPTRIVTNGVNEYYLAEPALQDVDAMRSRLELKRDVQTLLFMGSIHPYKGVDVFLESLNHVRPDFQAVIAGGFKSARGPDQLMNESKLRKELRGRVRFTGAINDAELRALYHAADLFVYPTRADTLPLVVLEAMASRLPVVSTTVGGLPFQVPRECGVLTPPDNAVATAEAVNELLRDAPRMRQLGDAARARVQDVFRWSSAAQSAIDGYTEILAGQSVRSNAFMAG